MYPLEFYRVYRFIATLTRDIWGKSMHLAFWARVAFYDEGFCTHALNVIVRSIHCCVFRYVMMWGKVGFSVDPELASPAGHWLSCVCVEVCVGGEGSSKCVNPFFLVAVPGPPSCFSPHIITILFLPHPLVTRPCTHSPSSPLVCLQRTSRFYEQSGHTLTRAVIVCVATHSWGTHCAFWICQHFASWNL